MSCKIIYFLSKNKDFQFEKNLWPEFLNIAQKEREEGRREREKREGERERERERKR